jgi:hypothetical protein
MKIEIEHAGSCLGATGGADGWSSATPWRKADRHTNLSFGQWSAVFGDAKMGFISDIV